MSMLLVSALRTARLVGFLGEDRTTRTTTVLLKGSVVGEVEERDWRRESG
jgi:hypothetical protein